MLNKIMDRDKNLAGANILVTGEQVLLEATFVIIL